MLSDSSSAAARLAWRVVGSASVAVPAVDSAASAVAAVVVAGSSAAAAVSGAAVASVAVTISDNVVVRRAEVEHSILLADSRIEDLDARGESSLVGRGTVIRRGSEKPRAYRFMVGDSSEIKLV